MPTNTKENQNDQLVRICKDFLDSFEPEIMEYRLQEMFQSHLFAQKHMSVDDELGNTFWMIRQLSIDFKKINQIVNNSSTSQS